MGDNSSASSGSKRYITLYNLPDVEEDIAKIFHSQIDTLLFNEETNQSQGTDAVITGNDPKDIITSLERIIIQMEAAPESTDIDKLIEFCIGYVQRLKNITDEMIENEMKVNSEDAPTRADAIRILVEKFGPQLRKRIKIGGYRKSRKNRKSKKSRKSRKARKTRSR